MRYCITDFGAQSGEAVLNTAAIRKTVQAAAAAGGGTVVVPPGLYVTGSFALADHVELALAPGAVLRASDRLEDWRLDGEPAALIYTIGATHTGIRGPGRIEGNGEAFMQRDLLEEDPGLDRSRTRQGEAYLADPADWEDGPVRPGARPCQMICFMQCQHVYLEGFSAHNPPNWTIQFGDCDFVRVTGLSIRNDPSIPNNDGIHCTRCRHVRISDCDITTGDDCIAITGFHDHPGPTFRHCEAGARISENIVVTNCVLSSRSAALRIGAGQDPIRHVCASNLVMPDTNRGVLIWQRHGNAIEHVRISDVVMRTRLLAGGWWGKAEPIAITSVRLSPETPLGTIRDVAVCNVTANTEGGVLVYGEEPGTVRDIRFRDIRLHQEFTPRYATHGGNFDLRPVRKRPELAIFRHDIHPFYAEQVDNLQVAGLTVTRDDNLPPCMPADVVGMPACSRPDPV